MFFKFQVNDILVENVIICVVIILFGVRGLGIILGSYEVVFLREVGDGIVYKGQEFLGDRDSVVLNVSRNKQVVFDVIVVYFQRRFFLFENENIFKNMFIFNFKNWFLGLEELQVYGKEQFLLVVDNFEELLIRNDCDIDFVFLEWVELKIYVFGLVVVELVVFYLDLWEKVIR